VDDKWPGPRRVEELAARAGVDTDGEPGTTQLRPALR
jgi:hypothetical protein